MIIKYFFYRQIKIYQCVKSSAQDKTTKIIFILNVDINVPII